MSDYSLSKPQADLLECETPTIDIVGEVNNKMFQYVRTAVMYLRSKGNPDIDVVITSPGGSVEAGLDIYDLLRLYKGNTVATVHDMAASMGALILQACDERRCAIHSGILIHHILTDKVSLDVLRSEKRLKKMIDSMEEKQARKYQVLAERTGKSVSNIRRECAKNKTMTAEEALKFGLIDSII